jgi:hypothetical protein
MNNAATINSLSPEELANLIQLAQNIKERNESYNLPTTINESLHDTSPKEQRQLNGRFVKQLRQYEGNQWTKGGATNKELVPELKKAHVDANQHIQQIYIDADKIRNTARAATELYQDLDTIASMENMEEIGSALNNLQQKCQLLAFYGFTTSKQLDNDARKLTSTAIRMPASMRYIADNEDDDKELAFSAEEMERLYTERFQERLLISNTNRRQQSYGHGKRGGRQQFFNNRPQHQQHQQKSFFGKPRHQPHQPSPTNSARQQPNQQSSHQQEQ